jgi:hypothetical protein
MLSLSPESGAPSTILILLLISIYIPVYIYNYTSIHILRFNLISIPT